MKFLKIICFLILSNVAISSTFAASTAEIDCNKNSVIKKLEDEVKNKLQNSFKAGIKPIKEDVSDISCLEDIWADVTKLFGKLSDWKMPDLSKPGMGDFDMAGFWDKAMNKAKEKACELMQDSIDSIEDTINSASEGLTDAAKDKIKGAVGDARELAKKTMEEAARPASDSLKELADLTSGSSAIKDQKSLQRKKLRKIDKEYKDFLYN
ncbi:MAG: hypothetical protein N4A43_01210 [Alphaproteobacteria bacterium]|nr:hypothetical protein [Alphaproteobacteria bacterium]